MAAVLDTHAAIWYVFTPSYLSQAAVQFVRHAIAGGKPLYISAISLVEIIYLVERKKCIEGYLVQPSGCDLRDSLRLRGFVVSF